MRDVLLDLDLMEDLLELLFVVSVEEITCDSVSGCVMTFSREQITIINEQLRLSLLYLWRIPSINRFLYSSGRLE